MDLLAKFMIGIEDIFNLNTCQVVVVKGRLDPALLERAIRKTAVNFPLLLSGLDKRCKRIIKGFWRPEHLSLTKITHDGDFTFRNPGFRRILMKTLQENPVIWKLQPPVNFYFLENASLERTALMFNTHHAVADAKSDFLLLDNIMRTYGKLLSGDNLADRSAPIHSYINLNAVLKNHPLRQRGISSLKNHLAQLKYDTSVRYFPQRIPGKKPGKNQSQTIDFHHEPLNGYFDKLIRDIAERSGQTINTVIFACLYRALQTRNKNRGKRMRIVFTVSLRSYLESEHRNNFQNSMITAGMNFDADYKKQEDLMNDICRRVQSLKSGKIFTLCQAWKFMTAVLRIPLLKSLRAKILRSITGTNACFSNPGRITERLTEFERSGFPILEHTGFGCLVPPYDFILVSPELNGRLCFNAVFRTDAVEDFHAEIIEPLKSAAEKMAEEFPGKSFPPEELPLK